VRVLLVHANPFQRVTPVPPYGLERLRTAAEQPGVEIEIDDPFLVDSDPIAAAAERAARLRPDVIGLGVRVVEDCVVIDAHQPAAGEPHDVSWLLPEIRELRRALGRAAPQATFVAGGAAFSAFPQECLEYLEIEWGVVGAGEETFREALGRLQAGRELNGIPGLVRRGGPGGLDAYVLPGDGPTRRLPLYAPVNAFPVRTRVGCAMQCAYCLAANLGRRHRNGDLGTVLDEVEAAVRAAKERGLPRVLLFFADDELNLPDEEHAVAVLNGIRERRLERRLRWRAYFNPVPFSDTLAELVRETNGHASVTVDTAAEAVMRRSQKPFRRRHLDALVERLAAHRVPADLGLIFGLPGETEETVAETVEFVRSLPPSLEVSYSAGARVYPHTPLARIATAEPERVVGSPDPTFLEPAVYASPWPPRELARRLEDAFAGLPHVKPVGVPYRSGGRTVSDAYRAVLGGAGPERWARVLGDAERGEPGRSGEELLAACLQVALWHGRFDLAAAGCRRLLAGERLPEGLSRRSLRAARLLYAGLGVLNRGRARPA
jgi:hypothetical protein